MMNDKDIERASAEAGVSPEPVKKFLKSIADAPEILTAADVVTRFGNATCPYDTDGDGDCPRCAGAKSLGCRETAATKAKAAGLVYFVAFGVGDRLGFGWVTGMHSQEDRASLARAVRGHQMKAWAVDLPPMVIFPDELPRLEPGERAALTRQGEQLARGLERLRSEHEAASVRPMLSPHNGVAIAYAADGGQALHQVRPGSGFLYDQDATRLNECAHLFGVNVVLIEDSGTPGQRVPLVGDAFALALSVCEPEPISLPIDWEPGDDGGECPSCPAEEESKESEEE